MRTSAHEQVGPAILVNKPQPGEGRPGALGHISLPAQFPVAANQTPTPLGPVTNTIGAMPGWGRLTVASIFESTEYGRAGLKIAGADVGNGGRVPGPDALAADDGPEVREWVCALQRGRHRGLVGEHQDTKRRRASLAKVTGAWRRLERFIDLYLPSSLADPSWILWMEAWARAPPQPAGQPVPRRAAPPLARGPRHDRRTRRPGGSVRTPGPDRRLHIPASPRCSTGSRSSACGRCQSSPANA